MSDEVEKLSRKRRRVLIFMAIAFVIWQLAGLQMFSDFAGGDRRVTGVVSLFAFAFWAAMLVILMRQRGVKSAPPEARAALDDELVQQNRMRAFRTGYWVMLVTAAIVFTASLFFTIEGNVAAQLVLVAGVAGPMLAFARLEGRDA
ncbi:hypothetical protein D1224_09240 [Henriciella barbarensis]|uniref:DUF2178 domain-containing protein n=1 Tax=Henriciella barbarensis TaxID=86342 RepID=A0A399R0T5_9PROT|nr:hypothetical protein [Henriciella barbarensis]RIJ24401.1 hypothetical protein D1224_09240 [Henriciella barbarensis]